MSLVDSRSEELLRAALGEEASPEAPQSRVEKILASIAGEEVQLDEPQSRVEVLLKALAESGGGGSGGLEYESGEWSPPSNTIVATVPFNNAHSVPPIAVMFADKINSAQNANFGAMCAYFDFYRLLGYGYSKSASDATEKVYLVRLSESGSTGSSTTQTYTNVTYNSDIPVPAQPSNTYSQYYVSPTGFKVLTGNTSRYWFKYHTYKWLAIWAPES